MGIVSLFYSLDVSQGYIFSLFIQLLETFILDYFIQKKLIIGGQEVYWSTRDVRLVFWCDEALSLIQPSDKEILRRECEK